MHEFSIAQGLIEAATAAAQQAGARAVTILRCRIGIIRQVDNSLLTDAFELAREGGLCSKALLDIEKVPLRAQCTACDEPFEVDDWNWRCPKCDGESRGLVGGDELELVSIEAEVDDEDPRAAERV